ncbi:hypothetical protein HL739_001618, partial [Campylobacter lari]|nr:hypothetical protein [Campylobacter lari]
YANIYEKNYLGDKNDWSWFYSYNRSGKEGVITSKEWFNKYEKIEHFAFVWSGMIDFMYLRKIQLKFIDRIFHQDIHFGISLFIQSSFIFLLPRRNLNYRIRNGATTIRKFKDECLDIPMYIEELLMYFNGDIVMTKRYYSLYSWIQIFIKFISISNIPQPMIRRIIFNLSKKISKFELDCKNDPLCIKDTKQVVCMLYDLCELSNDENIFNNVFRNS